MIITRALARPAILPRFFKIRLAERQSAPEAEEKTSPKGFLAFFESMLSQASAPMIKSMMDIK